MDLCVNNLNRYPFEHNEIISRMYTFRYKNKLRTLRKRRRHQNPKKNKCKNVLKLGFGP